MKTANKKLFTRNAVPADAEEIAALSAKVYRKEPYTAPELRGQINNFPEGVFVAVYEDKIVGYCATLRISERSAFRKHTWKQVTGGGYGTTHDPKAPWLYGYEVFVDPSYRRLRIGDRLYRERRNLCQHYRLKGIVIVGRLPHLSKRLKRVGTPEDYVKLAQAKKIKDPTFNFQARQGFEYLRILKNYAPEDHESLGMGALMVWRNPDIDPAAGSQHEPAARTPDHVRVVSVQYQQRGITSFEEFDQLVTYFVDVASNYKADFVLFPELFTLQLLSIENEPVASEKAIEHLTRYADQLQELFHRLAIKFNVNIIAGSHPTRSESGAIHNPCHIYLRDGSAHTQAKLHASADEQFWWNIEGGSGLDAIPTDCGPIGVLVDYDCEFPELARHLTDQGANILFVPFSTAELQGYLRIRYCAQARAVENQVYVVLAGNVGNLPLVHNMEVQYAQSCILTPCDFFFARDGVASDTTPNVEAVAIADLRMDSLNQTRSTGSRQDRRHELYGVVWRDRHR